MSSSPSPKTVLASDLVEIDKILRGKGFDAYGFAELTQPETIAFYKEWLAKGHHADMEYLVRHFAKKNEPQKLMEKGCSAFVIIKNYVPHPEGLSNWPLKSTSGIAAYAQGRDYHHFLKRQLAEAIDSFSLLWPDEEFVCFTDSAPVLERELAMRAGLGWVGKNTCLISRTNGSLFFIAEIYTSLSLPTALSKRSPDHCGTCRRCLDACPTGALVAPRELDARKCISYLTIESRDLPDLKLRSGIGHWLFGCDICQNVCPWNRKTLAAKSSLLSPITTADEAMIADLRFIFSSSNRTLERALAGTPLSRAGGIGLKRNALVVAGNLKVVAVREEVEALLIHVKLGPLATWALEKILDAVKTGL